jgi:hypothetical protein
MKKREERSKRRVWKFQGDRHEETHQYFERENYKEKSGFLKLCCDGDALQHVCF